jgi:hypothetical protein
MPREEPLEIAAWQGAVIPRRRGERVKSTLSRIFLSGRARHRHPLDSRRLALAAELSE